MTQIADKPPRFAELERVLDQIAREMLDEYMAFVEYRENGGLGPPTSRIQGGIEQLGDPDNWEASADKPRETS